MMTLVVGYSGIALIAGVIVLLDYLGRRQQRKARKMAGHCCSSPHADDFWP
jgi:hypothetical protein